MQGGEKNHKEDPNTKMMGAVNSLGDVLDHKPEQKARIYKRKTVSHANVAKKYGYTRTKDRNNTFHTTPSNRSAVQF